MSEGHERERWRKDSQVFAALGAELSTSSRPVRVRVPRALAESAVDASRRGERDNQVSDETSGQRAERHNASTLASIGVAIAEEGRWTEEHVEVELDAWHVGLALEAADKAGLARRPRGASDPGSETGQIKAGHEHLFDVTVEELESWGALFTDDLRRRLGNQLRLTKDYYAILSPEDRYGYPGEPELLIGQLPDTLDNLRKCVADGAIVIPMMLRWYAEILQALADEAVESAPGAHEG